jgi:hypothetical protein
MSYDFDDCADRTPPPRAPGPPPNPRDLETLSTMLCLAAIWLTPAPGTPFTFEELLAQANELGAPEIVLRPVDARIVVDSWPQLFKKLGRGRYCMR